MPPHRVALPSFSQLLYRRKKARDAFRLAVFRKYRAWAQGAGPRAQATTRLQAGVRGRQGRQIASRQRAAARAKRERKEAFVRLPAHEREAIAAARVQARQRGRAARADARALASCRLAEAAQWQQRRRGLEHAISSSFVVPEGSLTAGGASRTFQPCRRSSIPALALNACHFSPSPSSLT